MKELLEGGTGLDHSPGFSFAPDANGAVVFVTRQEVALSFCGARVRLVGCGFALHLASVWLGLFAFGWFLLALVSFWLA